MLRLPCCRHHERLIGAVRGGAKRHAGVSGPSRWNSNNNNGPWPDFCGRNGTNNASRTAAAGVTQARHASTSPSPSASPSPSVTATTPSSSSSSSSSSSAAAASPPPWRSAAILDEWVKKEARPISLKQLTFFGRTLTTERLMGSANYIREELPTRLAHRLRDMQTLPYVVVSNPNIAHVYERYYAAFELLRRVPRIETAEDNDEFCRIISRTLQEHLTVIPSMTMGVLECQSYLTPEATDRFMNNMLRARISRRVIAEQHIALTHALNEQSAGRRRQQLAIGKAHGGDSGGNVGVGNGSSGSSGSSSNSASDANLVGEVFLKCNAAEVVEKCTAVVSNIARQAFGSDACIPEVKIRGHLGATFPYILSHLEYIVGELLRNSFSATFERHGSKGSKGGNGSNFKNGGAGVPPVEVLIVEARQHVIFRFSDQGGGVPQDILPTLWSFGKSPRTQDRLKNLSYVPQMAATMEEIDGSCRRSGRESIDPVTAAAATVREPRTVNYNDSSDSSHHHHHQPQPQSQSHQRRQQQPPHVRTQTQTAKQTTKQQQQQQQQTHQREHEEANGADEAEEDESTGSSRRRSSLFSLASRPPSLRLGMGLPMSRVYAEYWAGSLTLQNLTGHGTDAFLQISKLGNKNEQLSTRASMDAL